MGLPTKPPIDYTGRDYPALRSWLLERLRPRYVPEWTDTHESDPGVTLVELFCAMADGVHFYADRAAVQHMPSYLGEGDRQVALSLMKLLSYAPRSNVPASVVLLVTAKDSITSTQVLEAGSRFGGVGFSFEATASKTFTFTTLSQDTDDQTDLLFTASLSAFEVGDHVAVSSPAKAQEVYEVTEVVTFLGALRVTPNPSNGFLVSDGATVRMKKGRVQALEGTTIAGEILGSSTGTAGQQFIISRTPYIQDSETVTVDEGVGFVVYTRVSSLFNSTSTDRHYELRVDEKNRRRIVFGDGVNGKIPPIGPSNIAVNYRVGGGSVPNSLSAGSITELVNVPPWVEAVTNEDKPAGGFDEETVAQMMRNGPASVRTNDRAVVEGDFESFALTVPGVGRAHAQEHPIGWNVVAIYIAPSDGSLPSQNMKDLVFDAVAEKMLLTLDLVVLDPTYVQINVEITANVDEHFLASVVKTSIETTIRDFFTIANEDFGKTVYRSDLTGLIEDLDGLQNLVYTKFTKVPVAVAQKATGDPLFGTITVGVNVKAETWTVSMTSATAFEVSGSLSGIVGTGTFGTLFSVAGVLSFTITAGALPAQAGDYWTFTTVAYQDQSIPIESVEIAVLGSMVVNVVGGQ